MSCSIQLDKQLAEIETETTLESVIDYKSTYVDNVVANTSQSAWRLKVNILLTSKSCNWKLKQIAEIKVPLYQFP